MKEYYVHANKADNDECNAAINSFVKNLNLSGTVDWVTEGRQTLSGEWATKRVPSWILDELEISQQERDAFLAVYGQDIRELCNVADFPVYDGN